MRSFGLFILSLLTGCSFNSSPTIPPTPLASLELYMARTNLFDTDFEQYKLQGQRLFIECGKLKRGRQMSETHDLFALTPEQRQGLEQRAGALLSSIEQSSFEFTAPGTNKHLADSGQLSLKLGNTNNPTEINTSVDAIAAPSQRPERLTKELVELLRSHSTKGCAKAEFYGIGRRQS